MPGAYNGLTARMIAQMNFKATYLSGASLTGSRGVPDIGVLGLQDFTQTIKDIYDSSELPIIADADTGFGEGEMCAKTVYEYIKAGAAGLHIEDQEFPKRCGHLAGKTLIPISEMTKKVQICANQRDKHSNGDFIICARTDARGVEGLDSAINRAKHFIDAGADMIFPEGLESLQEFEIVSQALKNHKKEIYLLANMTEFGKTPHISLQDFQQRGYSCVIYPVSTLRIAMGAIQKFLAQLQSEGRVTDEMLQSMLTRQELYDLLNYKPGEEWYYPSPKQPKE
eukprot:403371770